MLKIEELESVLVNAMNAAIEQGYLLICNDWGVRWDAATSRWTADEASCPTLCCDIFGALLLAQPPLDPALHQGDPDRAARMVVEPDFYAGTACPDLDTLFESSVYELCRNISNGWDNEEFLGGDEGAYNLGQRLADIYRPLSADVFSLSYSQLPVRETQSLDDYPDDEPFMQQERPSGVRPVATPSPELLEMIEVESAVG